MYQCHEIFDYEKKSKFTFIEIIFPDKIRRHRKHRYMTQCEKTTNINYHKFDCFKTSTLIEIYSPRTYILYSRFTASPYRRDDRTGPSAYNRVS